MGLGVHLLDVYGLLLRVLDAELWLVIWLVANRAVVSHNDLIIISYDKGWGYFIQGGVGYLCLMAASPIKISTSIN